MTSTRKLTALACDGGNTGRRWYRHARAGVARISTFYGLPYDRLCDLIALFSPRVTVKRNLRLALTYARIGRISSDVIRSTRLAVQHYETTGTIRGRKTAAFALVLRGDDSAIVLDTWMFRALRLPKTTRRKAIRKEACKRIRSVASELSVTPAQAQAMIWVGQYNNYYANPTTPMFDVKSFAPF